MNDTGFESRADALGARLFVATLVFIAPILIIAALVVIAMNEALWRFFSDAVATNALVPYAWAIGSALIVLGLGAAVGYPAMLIARRRARRETTAGGGPRARAGARPQ